MIDIKTLKKADKGRNVRYTSQSGYTVMTGVLEDWTADLLSVRPTAYEKPRKVPVDNALPSAWDPQFVEFA